MKRTLRGAKPPLTETTSDGRAARPSRLPDSQSSSWPAVSAPARRAPPGASACLRPAHRRRDAAKRPRDVVPSPRGWLRRSAATVAALAGAAEARRASGRPGREPGPAALRAARAASDAEAAVASPVPPADVLPRSAAATRPAAADAGATAHAARQTLGTRLNARLLRTRLRAWLRPRLAATGEWRRLRRKRRRLAPFGRGRGGAADLVDEGWPGRARRQLRHLRLGQLDRLALRLSIGPWSGLRERSDPRGLRLGAEARALRQLLPRRHRTHNVRFDHDVGRSADHQKMLYVITAHQHQAAAAIHSGGVDHGETGHPAAIRVGSQAIPGESTNQPSGQADQRQHGYECKKERQRLHLCPRQIPRPFEVSRLSNASPAANGASEPEPPVNA